MATKTKQKPYAVQFGLVKQALYFATRAERTKVIKVVVKAGGAKLGYSTWTRYGKERK